ncbi:unnamed protein product [Sordaria macrospora k-hell]|uniref:tRNA(Phe) 7-[(3-amino-3-carboxypropyl)-4-demethylwyosine(37)-N(4)]-methyltransferase n=1 Tax=Sordaria macrospora (strain ATCC MYA-333 / DSM 997 / K(L3346) / K-hell) TaxID=771870 RepID=F7VT00_SORMK|nr:uncharacterized protein SMAC_05458 [Sordaria macrospora k-hell]CCC08817.1 unnamed protein product [Sordaria macrospora k-hell]
MLPPPTPSFLTRKSKILSQLSVPDAEYTDASPKGSVDVAIRELIDEINHGYEGLVTTSSCAGRVSVYLEGVKKSKKTLNGASGGGGEGEGEGAGEDGEDGTTREPSGGGVTTATIQSGMTSGFRETGAVSILPRLTAPFFSSCHQCHTHHQHRQQQQPSASTPPTSTSTESVTPNPIVAIRSMGLSFESLIGVQPSSSNNSSQRQSLVTPEYLSLLVKIANERFGENKKRIARFREALRLAFDEDSGAGGGGAEEKKKKQAGDGGGEWEDAEARKQRKREEGLARREGVRRRKEEERERKRREAEEAKGARESRTRRKKRAPS